MANLLNRRTSNQVKNICHSILRKKTHSLSKVTPKKPQYRFPMPEINYPEHCAFCNQYELSSDELFNEKDLMDFDSYYYS